MARTGPRSQGTALPALPTLPALPALLASPRSWYSPQRLDIIRFMAVSCKKGEFEMKGGVCDLVGFTSVYEDVGTAINHEADC